MIRALFASQRSLSSGGFIKAGIASTTKPKVPKVSSPKIKKYALTASGTGVSCEVKTSSGFTLNSDIPKAVGGTNLAAEPVYLLLASLVGCETATAAFVARKMKIEIENIRFDVHASRDERGALELPITNEPEIPARLLEITGTAFVTLNSKTSLTSQQLETLTTQTHARCPVANMISSSGTRLDIKFEMEPMSARDRRQDYGSSSSSSGEGEGRRFPQSSPIVIPEHFNIAESCLMSHAREWPDAIAIMDYSNSNSNSRTGKSRNWSYREMAQAAEKLAGLWQDQGVQVSTYA